ncbi:hypothetical protein BDV95DRAFT_567814 [Massariosphaeria phaeospora]|uniref:Uncharacterized protein n=1 Tax=Massariosphaeria phaeospora TaxID=100035 RepID=A0A7C8I975_9PLEO|nr:hypothetical protein BDV95DRAFT_567814 [Massariosphaeria phaeospora]
MNPSSTSAIGPIPTRPLHFAFHAHQSCDIAFSFVVSTPPDMPLVFPPRSSPPRPRKRCRATTDVDGEHSCMHKKKRRLRLFLITSRLSPHYSYPATNIVNRGNSKIAVWAKQKALGRNLLRKAAILNRIRRRALLAKETDRGLQGRVLVEQEREQEQLELARLAFIYGSHDTHTRPVLRPDPRHSAASASRSPTVSRSPSPSPPSPPLDGHTADNTSEYRSPNEAYSYVPPRAQLPRRSHLPLPPSPLGLSNYDALDLEDEISDPYSHLDDDEEEEVALYPEDELDPSTSALSSASCTSTLATVATDTSRHVKTPPRTLYSDFSLLDPGEPVVGDFDQVDEGADPIWPNPLDSENAAQPCPISSPDFPALFATSTEDAVPMSPNFSTPILPSTEDLVPRSPNFVPFIIPEDLGNGMQAKQGLGTATRPQPLEKKDVDLEQERNRQRNLMFMRFGS